MTQRTAVIIGAGPAGLTAAYELLTRTDFKVVVLESTDMLGGLARTVNYRGNRIDIGGHRFFSKSDRVMRWWAEMLPVQQASGQGVPLKYRVEQRHLDAVATGVEPDKTDPDKTDQVMLVRSRKSRIYFLRRLFDYPLTLSLGTIRKLGLLRTAQIGASYLKSRLFPVRAEQNLEEFFINRFGKRLYETFFKSYTEKVWGVPCRGISAKWGAQRIKGLSVTKAVLHALKKPFQKRADIAQKQTETSLIEQFLYPKFGPGQMWETCAEKIVRLGGEIIMKLSVERIVVEDNQVTTVVAHHQETGAQQTFQADYCFSTMPIKDLIRGMSAAAPENVREVSEGLLYRDFITVGLLLDEMRISDATENGRRILKDNWIYIQEPDVLVGRLQIFNNWSPYLVADPTKVWLGMEYFCYETDPLWTKSDDEMADLAVEELARIGIIEKSKVLDRTVIRMPKAYPAYFGSYDRFEEIRRFVIGIENLFLIGRNGMHRYNNQDHSMLAAMTAVDNIVAGIKDSSNVWAVNTEREYIESGKTTKD
ncbi:MAG: NAD(P)/FAD-dependent oxidoreductase [Planctomycetia bacterium]|nr:NAD(P)/FAD-dependent oxidoreductase [Planctomycetia bacterium]